MENVNLELVIQQTISRFKQNRRGDQPLVFVSISPSIAQIAWNDGSLKELVRLFIYECLHTSDPDKAIEVLLTRRAEIGNISNVLGLRPAHWIQLRLSGTGIKYNERAIEDLFRGLGYRCARWLGLEDSEVRLGIFETQYNPDAKVMVGLNSIRGALKCDLLLPMTECAPLPRYAARPRSSAAPRV
jgi:hypothetical protein